MATRGHSGRDTAAQVVGSIPTASTVKFKVTGIVGAAGAWDASFFRPRSEQSKTFREATGPACYVLLFSSSAASSCSGIWRSVGFDKDGLRSGRDKWYSRRVTSRVNDRL